MAKRKSGKKQAPTSQSSVKSDGIGNALSALGNRVEDGGSSMLGTIGDKLKSAVNSYSAADDAQKSKLSESLDVDIQSLVGELKKVLDKNNDLEEENRKSLERTKQLENSAEEQKKKNEEGKKDLEKDTKQLVLSQKKNAENLDDVTQRLSDIKEQELDAESGFAKKHLAMLDKYEADKEDLLVGLDEKKVKLETQIKELTLSKDSLSEEESTLFDEKLNELSKKEDALLEQEIKLDQEKLLSERKLRQAQLSNEDANSYKQSLREEVKTEFLQQISSLENQKQNFENQIVKYQESESTLLTQLSAFKDIERQFEGASAVQILDKLEDYKLKVNDLKVQLDEKPSEQIEDQYKEIKKSHGALEQEYKNIQAELQKNKVMLNKNLMSVIELEQVEKQKQVLTKHNELLKGALDQLGADVDELVNKQQSKTAFPALLKLDDTLRANAITENIPPLNEFAEDLKQRIAWDEKEGKSLYYRLEDIQLFIAGLSMSRLHILQGISGTGKTSLAKAFARAVGGGCKIVSIQAGWRDKGDLVGHFNAFEKKFYEQETLQGLYEAQCPAFSDRPYIILLDEMNLSRPEQYFAEFLSALELDPKDRVLPLMTTAQINAPELLIDGRIIKIPENVWFIGTANHDETTFEFADKTYDRAHVMQLPRHKDTFPINKDLEQVTYSFSSLEASFESAVQKHKDKVSELVKAMDSSMFAEYLEEYFNVSWGNRLERHLNRFIPVMLECGSDLGFALDHMLATKVLREGKATGRYDTEHDDIESLIEALKEFWSSRTFKSKPEKCLKLLNNELKKKRSI